jgi:hypothetical protein
MLDNSTKCKSKLDVELMSAQWDETNVSKKYEIMSNVRPTVTRRQRFSFRAPRNPRKDTQVMMMPVMKSMLAMFREDRDDIIMNTPKPNPAVPQI